MDPPSTQIAERYQLRLSAQWQSWFDVDLYRLQPAGVFQSALPVERLASDRPAELWPGFMLPDTLPIIGNEYGDWICVRVSPTGQFGELLHWYHGGGDWVPLGMRLAEALVHDAVDQFRPTGRQVLRGATESIVADRPAQVLSGFAQPEFRAWLSHNLAGEATHPRETAAALKSLEDLLRANDYPAALQLLYEQQWSVDAVACDLIEQALQRPIVVLADPAIARSLELNWTPDYIRWLFDLESIRANAREQLAQSAGLSSHQWPQQDWSKAFELASSTLVRRQDLGWAFDIAGWCRQRSGDFAGAAAVYFAGRHASAFSDQAVRLRTHWFESRYGKFAMAQLANLRSHLPAIEQQDAYLLTVCQAPEKLTLTLVQEFWYTAGVKHMQNAAYAAAYECFYRAGWDMGVRRLSEYQRILELLAASARAAGWAARAAVAETHLACLLGRSV